MSAIQDKDKMIKEMESRLIELLQGRGNVGQEDLAYLMERVHKFKDERLKGIVVELIAWGDDERSEVETWFAISLEVMRLAKPSLIRQATTNVEIKACLLEKSNASV